MLESDAGTIASPIVSFPAGTPNLLHVSTLGDDSAGNGSPLTPYATIAKALARAGEGCEIRVAGGLYVEDLVSTVSDVTVSGSWLDDFSTRDLRNHRTVIKATASSKDCYTVSGSVTTSNTLCGVDLTGGRYGFNMEGLNQRNATTRDTLYQCVVSNCTIGVYAYNRGEGLALLSCLLADNAEDGVFARNDTGGPGWYYNCTFVRNGRSGAHRAHPYCMDRQHRNCVFVDNTSAFYTEHGFSGNAGRAYFENVLWFGNGQNIYHAAGALDSFDGGMAFTGVQLRADPKLGPDYTPAAGSPCIGAGKDFSADATVPFDADLYGTPWGGSWGLGCVKGIGQANAKFADVYVSPNGSDSNDGASASTAKASIGEALAVLADGGTCHVANGTYTEGVFLSVTNATLLGESRDGVVIQPVSVPAGATAYTATRQDFAVAILNGDITVKNVTLRNALAGVFLPSTKQTRDSLVENCRITGNGVGLCISRRDYQRVCRTRISHCAIVSNGTRGIYDIGALYMDNCLVADNVSIGIYSDSWDQDASSYFAFCTFTGNGAYGYYNDGGDSAWGTFANCVFEGHATAGIHARNTFTAKSCCFHNNAADTENNTKKNTSPTLADSVFGDPLLDTSAALRGHPGQRRFQRVIIIREKAVENTVGMFGHRGLLLVCHSRASSAVRLPLSTAHCSCPRPARRTADADPRPPVRGRDP